MFRDHAPTHDHSDQYAIYTSQISIIKYIQIIDDQVLQLLQRVGSGSACKICTNFNIRFHLPSM